MDLSTRYLSLALRNPLVASAVLLDGLSEWMARKGYASVSELRGILAVPADTDRAAYERTGYVRALRGANGAPRLRCDGRVKPPSVLEKCSGFPERMVVTRTRKLARPRGEPPLGGRIRQAVAFR
jgi:hypothetical protein